MACEIAVMAGELLAEIMTRIRLPAFQFDPESAEHRLREWISKEKYHVFVAVDKENDDRLLGFIAVYESLSLYAGGAFGTIPEFYVRPADRKQGVGKALLDAARIFGQGRQWTRLEVTTPPLPEFERMLVFYEREGFTVSGGRKMQSGL
jgi:GNAT superfamily N-acetyltransferase